MKPICLIACSAKKAERPCIAREMYQGLLFKKSVEYAESHCYRWGILSAKHGFLFPDERIFPYDFSMKDYYRKWEVMAWRQKVTSRLIPRFIDLFAINGEWQRIIFLAGKQYTKPLTDYLRQWKLILEEPLKGMGYGQQVRWLMDNKGKQQHEI